MTVRIGDTTLELNYVRHNRTTQDDSARWLEGVANVTWRAVNGGRTIDHCVDASVGCWDDTDDDFAEWAAWHEGARIIEKCFGGTGKGDMRGTLVQYAFMAACEQLGREVCHLLRDAAVSSDKLAYAEVE